MKFGFERKRQEDSQEYIPSLEKVKVFGQLERMLWYRYVDKKGIAPDADLNPLLQDWTDTYEKEFADIFEKLVKDDPEIVADWFEHPDTISGSIIPKIEQAIYPDEELKKAA